MCIWAKHCKTLQDTADFQLPTPGPSRAAASDANLTGRYWGDFDAIPNNCAFRFDVSSIHALNSTVTIQMVEVKKGLSWVSCMMERVCMGFQARPLQTKATERIEIEMRYLLSGLAAKLRAYSTTSRRSTEQNRSQKYPNPNQRCGRKAVW